MAFDDFVMTIDDDDENFVGAEEEDDDDEVPAKPQKKVKAAAKGKKATPGFNADFDFDMEAEVMKPWDFAGARERAKEQSFKGATHIDLKIKNQIAHKKEEARKRKRDELGSDAESDEDESDDESADEGGEKENTDEREEDEENEEDEEDEENEEDEEDEEEEEEEEGNDSEDENERAKKKYFKRSEVKEDLAFDDLGLSRPLLKAVDALGFKKPTPIQAGSIPLALQGKDICASAVTGSGKTAAFTLPCLERLLYRPKRVALIRVLIITPTRELAVQCHSMIQRLATYTDIRAALVVGGLSNKMQEAELRTSPDIVVCTPARMIDHLQNAPGIALDDIEVLILDEADRLLEMGFTEQVEELVKMTPKGRQTLLFSATMTEEVKKLIKLSLNKPERVAINPEYEVATTLIQEFVRLRKPKEYEREAVLLALTRTFKNKTLIFCRTKQNAHRLKIIFGLAGLKAAELHGNLTQLMRLEALESFRDGEVSYLMCTDVAARGLDIVGVETVINYEMPKSITTYVHRVGRTARAGRAGKAVSIVSDDQRAILRQIIKKATRDRVKSRQVAQDVIQHWKSEAEAMEDDVRAIYAEERQEKEMRLADMQLNKAQNMMEHGKEIYSRPAKTWFQSEKEKKAAKEMGNELERDDLAAAKDLTGIRGKKNKKGEELKKKSEKKDPMMGLNRKKRRKLMMKMEDEKMHADAQKKQVLAVKSAKSQERQARAKGVKVTPVKAPAGGGKKKSGGSSFAADKGFKAGGGSGGMAKTITGHAKAGGKKTGGKGGAKGGFKSKSKFKRR